MSTYASLVSRNILFSRDAVRVGKTKVWNHNVCLGCLPVSFSSADLAWYPSRLSSLSMSFQYSSASFTSSTSVVVTRQVLLVAPGNAGTYRLFFTIFQQQTGAVLVFCSGFLVFTAPAATVKCMFRYRVSLLVLTALPLLAATSAGASPRPASTEADVVVHTTPFVIPTAIVTSSSRGAITILALRSAPEASTGAPYEGSTKLMLAPNALFNAVPVSNMMMIPRGAFVSVSGHTQQRTWNKVVCRGKSRTCTKYPRSSTATVVDRASIVAGRCASTKAVRFTRGVAGYVYRPSLILCAPTATPSTLLIGFTGKTPAMHALRVTLTLPSGSVTADLASSPTVAALPSPVLAGTPLSIVFGFDAKDDGKPAQISDAFRVTF